MENKEKEIRAIKLEDVSIDENKGAYTLGGYITKYNSRSQFMGFYEEIDIGAFDESLANRKFIPALYNHDTDKILGSTRSGSLSLESDDIGLKFELRINPQISYAKDVYELVKSGDVQGCSFGMVVLEDEWFTDDEGYDLRIVKQAELYEVTITALPAYEDSEVSCRSYDLFKANQAEKRAKLEAEEKAKAEEEKRKLEEEKAKLELAKRKLSLELELI